ncbi:unnamed protein product [Rotaria sp. Silwood1]|nr:unnamed protein product [Rotaria sp. Silwood1]CAF1323714.1 unnamed protein product [Rotaria sp. Silwood1]CAF1346033.1 unnamed protein product [Rotaria sp. Silwood1]CAF3489181.1 unnamed protein product [Rotaria sp. Silwood1]CAF3548741.1 unnamed protein product [Rotaria sp. Silwood1]
MSRNERFLVVDTVEVNHRLRQDIDQLTNNREKIEAVIGSDFINPSPESSNHFVCVFVYHPASRTLHVDGTIIYAERPDIFYFNY